MLHPASKRVVARFLHRQADSYGDPVELLRAFREGVKDFAKHEDEVKDWLKAFAEVQRIRATGDYSQTDPIRKTMRQPGAYGGYREKGSDAVMAVLHEGRTGSLGRTGKNLCYALLQQLTLPQTLRRAVEASAKWWNKAIRLPKGDTAEESDAVQRELYLDHLETFRKYEKLYEKAIREGKAHSEEGEAATKLKAGPFNVINTGGFPAETMAVAAKAVEEAVHKLQAIGLDKVCYGNVLITSQILSSRTAAFYAPDKDELFVRPFVGMDAEFVRVICHELTHRLVNKFIKSRKYDIEALYNTLRDGIYNYPEVGTKVTIEGYPATVIDISERNKVVYVESAGEEYQYPIVEYLKSQGLPTAPKTFTFVTGYAKSGGPEENFCEMVSFYAMGKLPQDQLDLLLPILS